MCLEIEGIEKTTFPLYFTVCNYGEAGNYVGEKPYIAGKKGSLCPSGKTCI